MLSLGVYETWLFWVIWSSTCNCSLTKELFMVFVAAVATIYSCNSLLIIKIALLCCFVHFNKFCQWYNADLCICVRPKSSKCSFCFHLAAHSCAAVLPIDLPWAAHGARGLFWCMLHTLCWCLHHLTNLFVYYIPPHVPCIFSVCTVLQHPVCFCGAFFADFSSFTLQV